MVENKQIAEQIQQQRMDYRYRIHDNDTDIREPEDVYVLSEDFWSVFRDRYGCDLQIQVRKYKTLAEMVPKTISYGKSWSSFDNDLSIHYNQYEYLLEIKDEQKRCSMESNIMDELQNDRREFPRYYAIDAAWIDKWLAYM